MGGGEPSCPSEDLIELLGKQCKKLAVRDDCSYLPPSKAWVPLDLVDTVTKTQRSQLVKIRLLVQEAVSAASRCRICGLSIAKKDYRLGFPTTDPRGEFGVLTSWTHLACGGDVVDSVLDSEVDIPDLSELIALKPVDPIQGLEVESAATTTEPPSEPVSTGNSPSTTISSADAEGGQDTTQVEQGSSFDSKLIVSSISQNCATTSVRESLEQQPPFSLSQEVTSFLSGLVLDWQKLPSEAQEQCCRLALQPALASRLGLANNSHVQANNPAEVFVNNTLLDRPAPQQSPPPPGLVVSLLPFQQEGLWWLLQQEKSPARGGILADEMGMGKTVQMIALLLAQKNELKSQANETQNCKSQVSPLSSRVGEPSRKGGTLVVAPLAAVMQWKQEIETHCLPGALSVVLYHGSCREALLEKITEYDVVITSYSTVESDFRKVLNTYKTACRYCGRLFLPEQLKIHWRYFCGPLAVRTARQAKKQSRDTVRKAMKTLSIGAGDSRPEGGGDEPFVASISHVFRSIMREANINEDEIESTRQATWLPAHKRRQGFGDGAIAEDSPNQKPPGRKRRRMGSVTTQAHSQAEIEEAGNESNDNDLRSEDGKDEDGDSGDELSRSRELAAELRRRLNLSKTDIAKRKVGELKELLRRLDAPAWGTKVELLNRLTMLMFQEEWLEDRPEVDVALATTRPKESRASGREKKNPVSCSSQDGSKAEAKSASGKTTANIGAQKPKMGSVKPTPDKNVSTLQPRKGLKKPLKSATHALKVQVGSNESSRAVSVSAGVETPQCNLKKEEVAPAEAISAKSSGRKGVKNERKAVEKVRGTNLRRPVTRSVECKTELSGEPCTSETGSELCRSVVSSKLATRSNRSSGQEVLQRAVGAEACETTSNTGKARSRRSCRRAGEDTWARLMNAELGEGSNEPESLDSDPDPSSSSAASIASSSSSSESVDSVVTRDSWSPPKKSSVSRHRSSGSSDNPQEFSKKSIGRGGKKAVKKGKMNVPGQSRGGNSNVDRPEDVSKAKAAAELDNFATSDEEPDVDLSLSPLHSILWARIVLDEAHRIKGRTSSTARAIYALRASVSKWCLSGTPLQNRVGELYSLVRFLRFHPFAFYFCKQAQCGCRSLHFRFSGRSGCPKCGHARMSHFSYFNRHVVTPIQKFGWRGEGSTALATLKRDVLQQVLLRRTKVERAADVKLPPLTVLIRRDALAPAERDFYESLYRQTRTQFDTYVDAGTLVHNYAHIFDLLSRLRQAVDHPYLIVHGNLRSVDSGCGSWLSSDQLEQSSNEFFTSSGAQIPAPARADCETCGLCQDDIVEDADETEIVAGSGEGSVASGDSQQPKAAAVASKCGHVFHLTCAEMYMNSAVSDSDGTAPLGCPVCYTPLTLAVMAPRCTRGGPTTGGALRSTGGILSRIQTSQFKSSTKIEALVDELTQLEQRDSTSKSIVFSQYTAMLELIEWRVKKEGISCAKLTGSLSLQSRVAVIHAFRTDPNLKVILISLKAGGEGLNLQAANHIFLMDPWWNPAAEMQAIQRAHRIGQTKAVRAIRFICEATIEEKILQLQEKKQLVFDGTIGASESAMARLTAEDLKFLFQN